MPVQHALIASAEGAMRTRVILMLLHMYKQYDTLGWGGFINEFELQYSYTSVCMRHIHFTGRAGSEMMNEKQDEISLFEQLFTIVRKQGRIPHLPRLRSMFCTPPCIPVRLLICLLVSWSWCSSGDREQSNGKTSGITSDRTSGHELTAYPGFFC